MWFSTLLYREHDGIDLPWGIRRARPSGQGGLVGETGRQPHSCSLVTASLTTRPRRALVGMVRGAWQPAMQTTITSIWLRPILRRSPALRRASQPRTIWIGSRTTAVTITAIRLFKRSWPSSPRSSVVAIGENVDATALNTTASKAAFATAFGNLLAQFKNNGNPTIFVRSEFLGEFDQGRLAGTGCDGHGGHLCRPKRPWEQYGKLRVFRSNESMVRQYDHQHPSGQPLG